MLSNWKIDMSTQRKHKWKRYKIWTQALNWLKRVWSVIMSRTFVESKHEILALFYDLLFQLRTIWDEFVLLFRNCGSFTTKIIVRKTGKMIRNSWKKLENILRMSSRKQFIFE